MSAVYDDSRFFYDDVQLLYEGLVLIGSSSHAIHHGNSASGCIHSPVDSVVIGEPKDYVVYEN